MTGKAIKLINPVLKLISNTYKHIVININTVASFPFFETSMGFFESKTYIPPSRTNISLAISAMKKMFGKISWSQITNKMNTVLSTKGSRMMPSSLTMLNFLATMPSSESLRPITAITITSR